jgi:hypothetical protein
MSSVLPSAVTDAPNEGRPGSSPAGAASPRERHEHPEDDRAPTTRGLEVTAIVVTYRSRNTIDRASMDYILRRRRPHSLRRRDNASPTDRESRRGQLPCSSPPSPALGYGRGCNLGASVATTPLLLFLNPDPPRRTLSRD